MKKVMLLLMISLWTLVTACSLSEPPSVQVMESLPDDGQICRVAILPFVNETDYQLGDMLIYRIFSTEMVRAGNYLVYQEGDVRNILRQMRVLGGSQPSVEQIRTLAGRLGAQIVIVGTVVEMRDKSRSGRSLEPSLAIIVRILEAESGRALWTTYHRRTGSEYRKVMHFGVKYTLNALAQKVAEEIIDEWHDRGLKKCEIQ